MKKLFMFPFLNLLAFARKYMFLNEATAKLLFMPGFENARWNLGKRKATLEFSRAKKMVPAYKDFLVKNNFTSSSEFESIPVSDKETYVKKYGIDERCINGKMPEEGVVIDESSGSSGIPTNWVRGSKERKQNQDMLSLGLRGLLGKEPLFIINAFALGPWATGVNVTMAFVKISKLKSLGPDAKKIENTLKYFGTEHNYIIMGYPPFLKSLLDSADIDWKQYKITIIYGGEGMTESMRDYLINKGIRKIYGSYGASDLELNIAYENDFTIALRRLLRENESLAKKITQHSGTLPMIFQYNPMDFYIENNVEGELIITISRPNYIAPKIRYNIHDLGHVVRLPELWKILKEFNIDPEILGKPVSDLPLLFHYGRADMAVAYFGSKISPSDIQEIIYRIPLLSENVHAYSIETFEDTEANKKLIINLEMKEGIQHFENADNISTQLFDELKIINQDFREAIRMVPLDNAPQVKTYLYNTGPFVKNDIRIKLNYIIKN